MTCDDPKCRFHGLCHCGCGITAKVAAQTLTAYSETRGMPREYVHGHNPRSQSHVRTAQARAYVNHVPIEKVRPLVRWLIDRYGWADACRMAGSCPAQFSRILGDEYQGVRPSTAARIAQAVLEHKRTRSPWSMYEVEPAHLPPQERALIDDGKREEVRRQKRNARSGKTRQVWCECGKRVMISTATKCFDCRQKARDLELSAINRRRFGAGAPPLVRTG